MQQAHVRTGTRRLISSGLAGLVMGTLWSSCTFQPAAGEAPAVDAPASFAQGDDPLLVNAAWRITNMATAYGAFVIDVEAVDPARSPEIARLLIEPLKDRYEEVLIYVYRLGASSSRPERRIQWTKTGGLVEIVYGER